MDQESMENLCPSLIRWLQCFDTSTKIKSTEEISDGVVMSQILLQIAPEHFSKLKQKIKVDVGNNWRLKVSNLKKVLESIQEYYQDVLNMNLLDVTKPDVVKIGETSDPTEMGKILCLILGCAVNCESKQEYITQIMSLEESVQRSIMQAIQRLQEVTSGRGKSNPGSFIESDVHIQMLISELERAKDKYLQQCHNLEQKVSCLTEEKNLANLEIQRLTKRIAATEGLTETGEQSNFSKTNEFRRQIEHLQEDLFKAETLRDDYRLKVEEQQKEIQMFQEKTNKLQIAADETARLKDQIDTLTETADKNKILENSIASYKKKLEKYADFKKQFKTLEEKNVEYYQQNLNYEEELKKSTVWKTQCDLYKKKITELDAKVDEETQRADKVDFEKKKLESKFLALQGERDRLMTERDALKEDNEELRCQKQGTVIDSAISRELTPNELQERLVHLEAENRVLRSSEHEVAAKQLLLDDALQRLDKVMEQNRNLKKDNLELEAKLEDTPASDSSVQLQEMRHKIETLTIQSNEAVTSLNEYKQKNISLHEVISSKDAELQKADAKYKKSVEKAKDIANNVLGGNEPLRDVSLLNKMAMKETEERLLTTSFYRLSLACQREAVDERLAVLSAAQGQSFLARQRQPIPRKPVQTYKSK